jgi:hypothetical protein
MSCNSIRFFALATSDVIKLVFGNDDKNNLEKTILIVQARRKVKKVGRGEANTRSICTI